MENATDAMYMAFAVLIFVLALSITMSSFSVVRVAANNILQNQDRENGYTYIKYSKKDSSGNEILETNRIVGKETIVPAMFRAYAENYSIRFLNVDGTPLNFYIYDNEKINIIDLKNDGIANRKQANEFVQALVTGTLGELKNKNLNTGQFSLFEDLPGNDFSDIISTKSFKETLGIYYLEDLHYNKTDDVNKTPKRIITYTLQL